MKPLLRLAFLLLFLSTSGILVAANGAAAEPLPGLTVSVTASKAGELRISNVKIRREPDGFTVTWRTSQAATGSILYGNAPDLLNKQAIDPRSYHNPSRWHRVQVAGIEPNKLVYFTIESDGMLFLNVDAPFKVSTSEMVNEMLVTNALIGVDGSTSRAEAIGWADAKSPDLMSDERQLDQREVEALIRLGGDEVSTPHSLATMEAGSDRIDFEGRRIAGLTYPGMVLSDGQFVNGPNVANFNVDEYLRSQAPHLLPFRDGIISVSEYYSLNPRVLLVMMEVLVGVISATSADGMPFDPKAIEILSSEVQFMAWLGPLGEVLYNAYYYHLYNISAIPSSGRAIQPLIFEDGSAYQPPLDVNAASYALMAALAKMTSDGRKMPEYMGRTSPEGFYQTYLRLFPENDPLSDENDIWIPGLEAPLATPTGLFQLPYPRGEAWFFNTVHGQAGGSDRSAIDFAPYWLPTEGAENSNWAVVASAGGNVAEYASCQLKITHPGGWQTVYFHVENIRSQYSVVGNPVNKNARIADIANWRSEALCYSGLWDDPHLHFVLKFDNGQPAPIVGANLSGWTVYHDYMSRAGTTKHAGNDLLPNNRCNDGIGTDGVVLYEHDRLNFYSSGRCLTLNGDNPNLADISFNDIATGVRLVGSYTGKWEVRLYEHPGYQGAMSRVFFVDSDLSNNYVGNNRTSSVRMWPDADDGKAIGTGQTLNGTIDPTIDYDQYTFTGIAGQLAEIRLNNAGGGGFDPFVALYGPDGALLTSDDDSGPGTNSNLQISLPQSGSYVIRARSYRYATTGAYSLSLVLGSNPNCFIGQNGIVLYEHPDFSLDGRCLTLTESDSNLAYSNFNNLTSAIRFVGSYAVGYQVLLADFVSFQGDGSHFWESDTNIGDRVIGHDRTSSVKVWPESDDFRTIFIGQTLNANINVRQDIDIYRLNGSAGETLRIDMTKSSLLNGLDTYLILYGPDGTILDSDDDGGLGLDSRIEITLPSTGTYTIRCQSSSYGSDGGYNLSVNWN